MPNDGVDERDDSAAMSPEDVRDTLCTGDGEQDDEEPRRHAVELANESPEIRAEDVQ